MINPDQKIAWIARIIVTCSAYAREDLECTCFLKSTEPDRIMKSECVSMEAPQAIIGDWRVVKG
jgi:hypothetical protein